MVLGHFSNLGYLAQFYEHQQVNIKMSTSNLFIISPTFDAQESRPNCTKSAEQHIYAQGSRPNCTKSTKKHVYTPNQLRSIGGKQYKNGNKPRILPFGAIWQYRNLHLNKIKEKIGKTYTSIYLSKP